MEIWKDIPKYEGRYKVSNLGRVKSYVSNLNGRRQIIIKEKILKPIPGRDGYLRACLTCSDGTLSSYFIHRLVLIAFKGYDKQRIFVNHINGKKQDNRLENLEWVTSSENMKHAYRIGLEKPCDNGLKKKIVMMKDGCPVREYISIREMCRKENLDRRCVMRTLSGKYAHHHGFTFKIII